MKHAWQIAVAGALTMVFVVFLGALEVTATESTAAFESFETLESFETEDLDELTDLLIAEGDISADMEDEISDEELNALIDDYFSQMESGAIGAEGMQTDIVTNPPLILTQEADGMLRYTFPNGSFFRTTVPQGMLTTQPVELKFSDGVIGMVRKDDELNLIPESWHFSASGNYQIKMISQHSNMDGAKQNYSVYEMNFYFTIIDEVNSRIGAIPAPEGFKLKEVRLNEQILPIENERCFFLTEDGHYEVWYTAEADDRIRLSTTFIHDTTAPFLSFSKELNERGTEGPLEFYVSEPDCRVSMSFNGDKGYILTNVLTTAGNYELRVEDASGNQRSYYVRIRQTYDMKDIRIILIATVGLALVSVWMVLTRRNMRVW